MPPMPPTTSWNTRPGQPEEQPEGQPEEPTPPMYASILAGGSGTRLWPLSAKAHPKQFLPLPGPRTMLQETVARIAPLVPADRLYVVTFDTYAQAVAAQAPMIDPTHIIAEPAGRGTAASIGLAATLIAARDPHAVMGSFHADHAISDVPGFRAALRFAQTIAQRGALVTLGIAPTYPETGYGYIRYGEALAHSPAHSHAHSPAPGAGSAAGPAAEATLGAYRVEQFVEKPQRHVAEAYLRAGHYVWNSGIFVWRVDRILDEIRTHVPQVSAVLDEIAVAARASGGRMTQEVAAVMRAAWPRLRENVTIDVGVLEQAQQLVVIPMSVGWNDIGSWSQVATLYPADAAGNVVIGLQQLAAAQVGQVGQVGQPGTATAQTTATAAGGEAVAAVADGGDGACLQTATRDTLVYSTTGRHIATAGVEGLIIVDTPDGLLVCSKEHAQLVKDLAEADQRRRAQSEE
ncbi:MAG TPA: mannose-1-phosphate guanylyltransferase [Ktedonobacterales bacterium]|nr:mannose-1-phosphate guanylyltransferase [Ktedonobacterales bacterium]